MNLMTPIDVSERPQIKAEDLLRLRVRFILSTAYTIPIQFGLNSVIEQIQLNMNQIKDVIISEAAEHGWYASMNEGIVPGMISVSLKPSHKYENSRQRQSSLIQNVLK